MHYIASHAGYIVGGLWLVAIAVGAYGLLEECAGIVTNWRRKRSEGDTEI